MTYEIPKRFHVNLGAFISLLLILSNNLFQNYWLHLKEQCFLTYQKTKAKLKITEIKQTMVTWSYQTYVADIMSIHTAADRGIPFLAVQILHLHWVQFLPLWHFG